MASDRGSWALQGQGARDSSKATPNAGSSVSSASKGTFIPSATWQGSKAGYYFGLGDKGQGYYGDGPVAQQQPAAVAQPRTAEDLLQEAEQNAGIEEIQLLDARGLKRLVTTFEKKYKENLELRMKYADAPEKFLDSEVDLDEQVKGLMQVAGSPELYPLLVELNPLPTMLACLTHENTDIAADTLEVLRELTDADAVQENGEEAKVLANGLLEANALELLVQRLTTLNEKVEEEAKAVFNCLHIFENLIEVDTSIAEQVVEKTRLLKWLLTRVKSREFDGNKLQASELLAVLVQGSEANQRKLAELNGIDTLLWCTSLYKGRDPSTANEEEFMQNCFDILCSTMMVPGNKQALLKAEGVELLWLMMENKRQARYGALKLLDFACTRFAPACERLVDVGGLKHIFSAFMGKTRFKGFEGQRDVSVEVEERCVSLIASLMTQMGPQKGRRERLGAKFVEAEFEKTDRLLELYFRYSEKVATAVSSLVQEVEAAGDELEEEELEQVRLDSGLFTLQQAALLLGLLWALNDLGLRKRVLAVLHLKSHPLGAVREVLLEYVSSLGEAGSGADAAPQEPEEREASARARARATEALLALGASKQEVQQAFAGTRVLGGAAATEEAVAAGGGTAAGKQASNGHQAIPATDHAPPSGLPAAAADMAAEMDMDDDIEVDAPASSKPRKPPPVPIKSEPEDSKHDATHLTSSNSRAKDSSSAKKAAIQPSSSAGRELKEETPDGLGKGRTQASGPDRAEKAGHTREGVREAERSTRASTHDAAEPSGAGPSAGAGTAGRGRDRDDEVEKDGRDRGRDRGEKHKSDRDKDKDRDRLARDKERAREKEKERDNDKEAPRERDRDGDRGKARDRGTGKDRERDRERDRSRSRSPDKKHKRSRRSRSR